ncbi:hypothetical protein JJQ72_02085 [Paenibacillus sp. F411]|uniref:hypothetical protein n=1 Tax=Paenibacillus sp. F411 TaxID=2820239 RepID=UPI001AAE54CB|nr:hypothetical protein [Paenibacillus sp. F411]MBO2942774.1 hypothetical protein [Paenibacillus sp. F411]
MNTPVSRSPADVYIATTQALRASTVSISQLIMQDPDNIQRLNELKSQREEAYLNWANAAYLLKTLPAPEMAVVLNRIEQELNI